jgi:hypothetical protein
VSRPRLLAGTTLACVLFTLLALPATVAAHVTRTVGPYTFLVTLVEEPFFATNHAGFELWVTDASRDVAGLDRTLTAEARGPVGSVPLAMSAQTDRGSYVMDTDARGVPFDPGRGGEWILRLRGDVRGTHVNESFSTAFPAYPRVASGQPAGPPVVPGRVDDTSPLLPLGGVVAAVVAAAIVARTNASTRRGTGAAVRRKVEPRPSSRRRETPPERGVVSGDDRRGTDPDRLRAAPARHPTGTDHPPSARRARAGQP